MLSLLNGQPQVTVEGTSVLGTVLALFYNSPGCHLDNPCLFELNRLFFWFLSKSTWGTYCFSLNLSNEALQRVTEFFQMSVDYENRKAGIP